MATGTGELAVPPGAAPALPAAPQAARALRSRRELRPGMLLAGGYAWGLAMARLIDVSDDGKFMLLFGLTFSMIVTFAALARPRWYLLLVVAYLPFSKIYPLPVAGIPGANLTNLLLVLGPVAIASSRMQGRPRVRLGAIDALVLVFMAVASLSLLPAWESGSFGLGELLQTYRAWLAPMLFFLIARGLVRDREDVAGVLEILAWTTFLVAAVTWKEGLDRSSRGSIDRSRVPGLMVQANIMGAFLVYYGIVLLALAVTARPRRNGLRYLVAFAFAARATLYTFSRGAYLALAAGSATVLLVGSPALFAAAGAGGTVAVLLFPSLVPESVRARLAETTAERSLRPGEEAAANLDRSSANRLMLWRAARTMIAEHPLIGVGLGRFPETIGFYTELPLRKSDPRDAHNAYLLQAAEMGVPSLLLLLLLYFVWGVAALRLFLRRRHPVDRRLALAFLGSLIGVLVSCLLGSRFSDEALVGWFWILAGMLLVIRRLREPRRRRVRRPALRAA
jgi:putative inorganic carbon (HCO3(-)) transporter